MGLFKKQKIEFEENEEKTPVKFRRREKALAKPNRKKAKRIILGVIFLVVFAVAGYFGYKAWNTIQKVFSEDSGILSLISGSPVQPLKGEANGRTNVLILGVGDKDHSGATLSDTIMLASYDTKSKNVALFSVPRDLYVQIPKNGYTKINAAHAYGEQNKYPGGGPALAKETIEKTFDLPIHYYIRIDFSGLADTVDALGGIEVDVENTFCDYNYPVERKGDTQKVCFTKGKQTMNGTKALQYSRSRHALGVEGSDFARSKRQQKVMIAIKDKAMTLGTFTNPKKMIELMDVLGEHVKTDFSVNELVRLYQISKELTSEIITKNFDNSPNGYLVSSSSPTAGYILQPRTGNWMEIQGVVKNIFQESGMRNEKASIGIYNGTWNTGLAVRLAEEMNKTGYNVTKNGDADNKNYQKTVIYDYTNGQKPATIKALETKFKVVSTKQPAGSEGIDIKVIVGRDYKEY